MIVISGGPYRIDARAHQAGPLTRTMHRQVGHAFRGAYTSVAAARRRPRETVTSVAGLVRLLTHQNGIHCWSCRCGSRGA